MADAQPHNSMGSVGHAGVLIQSVEHFHPSSETSVQLNRAVNRELSKQYVTWLRARFVAPNEYSSAHGKLYGPARLVLLIGERQVGRRATATMLLHGKDRDEATARHLVSATDGDKDEPVSIMAQEVHSGERLFLDLSDVSAASCKVMLHELRFFHEVIQKQKAHLVVAVRADQRNLVPSQFEHDIATITPPPVAETFAKYLQSDEISASLQQISSKSPEIQKLTNGLPGRVSSLAKLVHESAAKESAKNFKHWFEAASEAFTNYGATIIGALTGLPGGWPRALLWSAAMFEGASARTVFSAAETLMKKLEYPYDAAVLTMESPSALLASKDVSVASVQSFDAKIVSFNKLGYGQAVRAYFWHEFSGLQDVAQDWLVGCLALPDLTPKNRTESVGRYVELCLWATKPDDLIALIEKSKNNTDLVEPIVTKGLLHEQFGSQFRRKVYDWSKDVNQPQDFALMLIEACGRVIANSYPDQALVRLDHLTKHRNPSIRQAAKEKILFLTEKDNFLFRRLLYRVTGSPSLGYQPQPSNELFMELIDPRRLADDSSRTRPMIREPEIQSAVLLGWKNLLRTPKNQWRSVALRWWNAEAERPANGELLELPIAACQHDVKLLSAMYVTARDWNHPMTQRLFSIIDVEMNA
jgi:hypothetical protein